MVAFPGITGDIHEKIVCPVCNGTRLSKETTYFKIAGKTISEVAAMEISQLQQWFGTLDEVFGKRESLIARDILKELKDRVSFLLDVGLDYLSLDRATASLSGGEGQRIRLATQIGSKLVNVLYILDEPEAALSPSRQMAMLSLIKRLVDQDSQFIISTHSPILMAYPDADIIELDETGFRSTPYKDTSHYRLTSYFLNNPEKMLAELM